MKRIKVNLKSRGLVFFFAFCLLPFAFACGKRRPPSPPLENVPQRTELLSGTQRGNQVILSWPALRRNASDSSAQSVRRIDIYRLAEPADAPLPLTEEQFAARSTLIGSVPFSQIQAATDNLTYVDILSLTQPVRLRYALRYVNAFGQRASFSNFLLIVPASRISEPPNLTVVTPGERTITVRWDAPVRNVDGSAPVNILGYNVYRTTRAQIEPAATPLNSAPINANEYADQSFEFGEEYSYIVRTVSLGTGGEPVESLNSNLLSITPRDEFAPSAPTSITIAAAPGRLSLFFPANPERDVAGYNIYRSTDPNLPRERWTLLTRAPLTRTTYQDESVVAGQRYYYYVTAIDAAGNPSQPSEVASETAP